MEKQLEILREKLLDAEKEILIAQKRYREISEIIYKVTHENTKTDEPKKRK